jgi:hypothetical protein
MVTDDPKHGEFGVRFVLMERISQIRFDALAGYSRSPRTLIDSVELEWYSDANEKVLGALIQDTEDFDYSCIVMGRDRAGRYRAVHVMEFMDTVDATRDAMPAALQEWAAKDAAEFEQGDEPRAAVDFFTPIRSVDRLHPAFQTLTMNEGYSPARGIIAAQMYYFDDPDGNFVEQFQTAGFDARIWELYLFAVLAELRFGVDRNHPAPDFLCWGLLGRFFIEAVTVNPTIVNGQNMETGRPDDPVELDRYMKHYLPIKFGGPLTSKLNRRYWELPHVGQQPIVIAIQDFHYPQSMTWSETSLVTYLYGYDFKWHHDDTGNLVITPERMLEHAWGQKRIPSGFFHLPGAEHISAVISNRQGTISKFNRMGLKAGFGSDRVRMVRVGRRYVDDPNSAVPGEFTVDVNDPEYRESWIEGMCVFHNPNAEIPLPPEMLPGAAHHFFEDGRMHSYLPEFHPYGTRTFISVQGEDLPVVGD